MVLQVGIMGSRKMERWGRERQDVAEGPALGEGQDVAEGPALGEGQDMAEGPALGEGQESSNYVQGLLMFLVGTSREKDAPVVGGIGSRKVELWGQRKAGGREEPVYGVGQKMSDLTCLK